MENLGFPGSSVVKNLPTNARNARDTGSIPEGKSPGAGNGNLLQYSCLGNPTDRKAWWATVLGLAKAGHNSATNNTAAAAKLLQSCPTLCDPIDGSPPGSPVPGIVQAGTLEWVAISFSNA